MQVTYEKLISEIHWLTQMYWIDPNTEIEEEEIDSEESHVEFYIKDYLNRVHSIVWKKTLEQLHWKNPDDGHYKFDERTVLTPDTIISICDELDVLRISEDMMIAFRYLLDEPSEDIFDEIVYIYDENGNLDLCEHIASKWLLDSVKSNEILNKLYQYCDHWNTFIDSIWFILEQKWIRLDDFRKSWELDEHEQISSYIVDIQRLILSKVGSIHINTSIH